MIWKSTRVLFVVFTGKSYKMSHILWVMQWKFCIKCTNSVLYISKSWNIDKTAVPNRSIRAYWLSKGWYLWHTKTSMVSRFQLGSSQKPSFSFGLSKSFSSEQRVTVMLVTSFRWWLYDGDWFDMLVAESFNMSNLSPTHLVSIIRHQHRCNRFLVEIFPAASSTHKIGIKVLQIQHRMFRICLKLTVTFHLQFCPREIWKVEFNPKILEFVIDIGFILTDFQRRFDSTLKIQVKLFCESNPKFPEFNLYKTHSSQTRVNETNLVHDNFFVFTNSWFTAATSTQRPPTISSM